MKVLRVLFISLVGLACAFLSACGGGSSTPSVPPNTITTTGQNVVSITANGGPQGNYVDAMFASVTVCVPGTTTCQTVDDVLVDTGSVGLRLLASELTSVTLPQQTATDGNPVAECLQFLGSYTWGPVQTADIELGGEKASSVPIQVLSDTLPGFGTPLSCSDVSGASSSADTQSSLGANGILGVGLYPQDCGSPCPAAANMYYECPTSGCVAVSQNLAQQVANPVALFATDNNGVIIELPAVSASGEATLTGSMVFGIGTQTNNALGSATVYTVDAGSGNFTTIFDGTTYTNTAFLDTGSNGYFFLDNSIPQCSDFPGFYCPTSTVNLTATNQGTSDQGSGTGSGTVNFSIANTDTLFSNASDFVFGDLGATIIPSGSIPNYFDWGLPFFFGRNVYVSIDLTTAPGGATPYWAY